MVDRITPETDAIGRELVTRRFGLLDRSPVITEPFTQWVIEDRFCTGRPPLDRVGVRFVDDVTPYKLMKTRLLNAGHSALGYLGYLGYLVGGYTTSSEAMTNPVIRDYLAALMCQEITASLPEVPGIDLATYQRTVLERFSNPQISDQLSRLCGRGSTKVPAYLLPSLIAARAEGRPTTLLTLAVAGWCRYLQGHDLNGDPIEINDPRRNILQPLALAKGTDPRPLFAERDIFGHLGDDPEFVRRPIDRVAPQTARCSRMPRAAVSLIALKQDRVPSGRCDRPPVTLGGDLGFMPARGKTTSNGMSLLIG